MAKATENVKPRNIKTGNWINPAPPPLNAEKVFASKEMTNRIKQITYKVYQILGLKGMCRVDYILVGKEPHVIEVNTVPGLSAQSLIPQMAAYEGISLKELFSEVIKVATKK